MKLRLWLMSAGSPLESGWQDDAVMVYLKDDVDTLLTDIRRQLAARAAANLEAEFMAILADTGGER